MIGTESSFLIMDFAKQIMDLSLTGKLFASTIITIFHRCIAFCTTPSPASENPLPMHIYKLSAVKLCWIQLLSVTQHAWPSVLTYYCPPHACCIPPGKLWEMRSRFFLSIHFLSMTVAHVMLFIFALFFFLMKHGALLKFFTASLWKNKIRT